MLAPNDLNWVAPNDLKWIEEILAEDGSRLYQRFLARFAPAADAHSRLATIVAPEEPNAADVSTAPPLRIRSRTPSQSVASAARSADPSVPAPHQLPDPGPEGSERAEAARRRSPRTPDTDSGVDAVLFSAIELVSYDTPPPERIGASANLFLDQYDWLQLTIGRFLAPAAHDHNKGKTVYVLPGHGEPADGGAEEELRAFDQALSRLQTHLGALIDADPRAEDVLVSLRTVLELRLPRASRRSVHLRDGSLLFTGWGLDDRQGVRIRDILPTDARRVYRATLAAQLTSPAGADEPADAAYSNDSPAPPSSRPDTPKRRRPAPPATDDAEPSHSPRLLRGLVLLLFLVFAFVAVLLLTQHFWNPA